MFFQLLALLFRQAGNDEVTDQQFRPIMNTEDPGELVRVEFGNLPSNRPAQLDQGIRVLADGFGMFDAATNPAGALDRIQSSLHLLDVEPIHFD